MLKMNNILVAVDLDTRGRLAGCSEAALNLALALSERHRAALTVMHVVAVPETSGAVLPRHMQTLVNSRKKQALRELEEQVQLAGKSAVHTTISVRTGTAWQEVLGVASHQGFDLVVTGSRGRGVVTRMLFGSVSNRLLRYCNCPVLAVRQATQGAPQHILVAHDLTSAGKAALEAAAVIALACEAEVSVLHVLELLEDRLFLGEVIAQDLDNHRAHVTAKLQAECRALGLEQHATIQIAEGEAYAAILDYLGKHPVDLLSMGTVANSGLKGVLVGNTAENILPWVSCSLLAVKPENFVNPVSVPDPDTVLLKTGMR
jgi:universal stress protein E